MHPAHVRSADRQLRSLAARAYFTRRVGELFPGWSHSDICCRKWRSNYVGLGQWAALIEPWTASYVLCASVLIVRMKSSFFSGASATACHFPAGSSSCAVTASIDGCVKIWDVKTARAQAEPEGKLTLPSFFCAWFSVSKSFTSQNLLSDCNSCREWSAHSLRLLYQKLAHS